MPNNQLQVDNATIAATTTSSYTTTTPLTLNSISVCVTSAGQATVSFQTGGVTYWTAFVSQNLTAAVLGADVGNATVTFMEGLTVSYAPLSQGNFNVLLNGPIKDNNNTFIFTGLQIGSYTAAA